MTPSQQMMANCALLYEHFPVQAVLLTIAACISVALCLLGIHRRKARGAREFILVMAAVALWTVAYFFELVLPTQSAKFLVAQVEYLGIAAIPPLWLLMAARTTGRLDLARPLRTAALFIVPLATLALAATSRLHGLLWSSTGIDPAVSPPILRIVHGPYFYVNLSYSYLLLVLGTGLFTWSLVASPPSRRSVSAAMIVAVAAPWIGNLLYILGLNPAPSFDITPICFAVSGSAVAWVLFRHGFLDIVPFARDKVIETMQDPVFVVDAEDGIVDANPAAAALAGVGRRGVGRHVREILPAWDALVAAAGEGASADVSLAGPAGSRLFEADVSAIPGRRGSTAGRVVVLHDVTGRRSMEQGLRSSEEKYRRLVEGIDQVIFSVDAGGVFTYVSPSISRMSRYVPGDIVGKPFASFVHPGDAAQVARNIQARNAGAVGQNEFRVMDKDGSVLTIRTSSSPVSEEGSAAGLTGIMTDITEQRRLAAELHQSQKMEAVGRLAGGVAHDFNNLLSAIAGFAELLLLNEEMDGESREMVGEIRKSIERGAGLVRQLLAFGRKQVLQPRLFCLNEMVQGLEKMLSRLIGEEVKLALDLAASPCPVRADRGQVELAVINLVVNARDAMPGGGALCIATRCVEGGGVALQVRDTGCGMDDAVKSRLFEPFFTTKDPGNGTGLGLSAVYGIVKQSGGTIRVESSPGKGTTVEILFPAPPAEDLRETG